MQASRSLFIFPRIGLQKQGIVCCTRHKGNHNAGSEYLISLTTTLTPVTRQKPRIMAEGRGRSKVRHIDSSASFWSARNPQVSNPKTSVLTSGTHTATIFGMFGIPSNPTTSSGGISRQLSIEKFPTLQNRYDWMRGRSKLRGRQRSEPGMSEGQSTISTLSRRDTAPDVNLWARLCLRPNLPLTLCAFTSLHFPISKVML